MRQLLLICATMLALAAGAETYDVAVTQFTQKHYPEGDTNCKLMNQRFTFYFDINVSALEYNRTYTMADMQSDFTGFYDKRTDKDLPFAEVQFTYLQAGERDSVHVVATTQAGDTYVVTYVESMPDVTDQFDITTYNMTIDDKDLADRGVLYVDAMAQLYEVYFILKTWQITGTFNRYDVELEYSFVGDLDSREQGFARDAELTLDVNSDLNIYHLTGWVLCDNGWLVELNLYSEGVMPFDVIDQDVEASFTEANIDLSRVATGGGVHLRLQSEEQELAGDIAFVLSQDELVDTYVIPEGTYPVSENSELHTVVASPGVVLDEVYSSFVATFNGSSLSTPLWLVRSGEVTVSHQDGKLSVEVDALNSNERSIRLHVLATPFIVEGIECLQTTMPAPRKMLRNGQLIIIRNNNEYTILGQ